MKQLSFIIIALFYLLSCSRSSSETKYIDNNTEIDSALALSEIDTTSSIISSESDTLKNITKKSNEKGQNRLKTEIEFDRYMQLPSDAHFNGWPMTQQLELSKSIIEMYPDTLKNLAMARYQTYDIYFPIEISDNFEKGVSTETVTYPKKLIFRFEIFEDKYADTPYLKQDIVVKRRENGELYVE